MAATSVHRIDQDCNLRNRKPEETKEHELINEEKGVKRGKVENEYEERRRRIADVFMKAYGTGKLIIFEHDVILDVTSNLSYM